MTPKNYVLGTWILGDMNENCMNAPTLQVAKYKLHCKSLFTDVEACHVQLVWTKDFILAWKFTRPILNDDGSITEKLVDHIEVFKADYSKNAYSKHEIDTIVDDKAAFVSPNMENFAVYKENGEFKFARIKSFLDYQDETNSNIIRKRIILYNLAQQQEKNRRLSKEKEEHRLYLISEGILKKDKRYYHKDRKTFSA